MPMIVTNIDLGSVMYSEGVFNPVDFKFLAAETWLEGTILARVESDGTYVPFVVGGTANVNGTPKVILTYESTSGITTISGKVLMGGVVVKERLVIHGDADLTNLTEVHIEQLRDYGILTQSVQELSVLDNQ